MNMTIDQRADYSQALLTCSVNRRMIAACPIAFGEVNVKNRIKTVLNYKKPTFWIILVAIIASIVVAACFLTNPVNSSKSVLDKLFNSDEYDIVKQKTKRISLSIPISKLPSSIYTKEGITFKANEFIAYKDETTTIYLKEVLLTDEENKLLSFCFDFSYNLPKKKGTLLHPEIIKANGQVQSPSLVVDGILKNGNNEFIDAVTLQGQGPNCLLAFYVSADALKQCEGDASFDISLNHITYCLNESDYKPIDDNADTDTSINSNTNIETSTDTNNAIDINQLKTKYPTYFNLDTTKGLTVYIWQMSADSYYCGLLPNSDIGHTELELFRLHLSSTSIDEMRSIVTYYYPYNTQKYVTVCPIIMPISSYTYTIDDNYIHQINELFWGKEIVYQMPTYEKTFDYASFDIDNDGIIEECSLGYGPTSGIYTFTFSVYENRELEYFNIFASFGAYDIHFDTNEDGQVQLCGTHFSNDSEPYTRYMSMAILDGNVSIFSDEQDITYWGEQGIDSPFAPK